MAQAKERSFMPTFWDAFLEDYPDAKFLPMIFVLEAFYNYINILNRPHCEQMFKVARRRIIEANNSAEVKCSECIASIVIEQNKK